MQTNTETKHIFQSWIKQFWDPACLGKYVFVLNNLITGRSNYLLQETIGPR